MSRMWPHHDRDDLLCVAIVMEKVESSRSKVHCFRGANDGSWPVAAKLPAPKRPSQNI